LHLCPRPAPRSAAGLEPLKAGAVGARVPRWTT
jgi:hypothetical protein